MAAKKSGGLWDTVKTLIYAVLIALFIRTFAFEPFNIPSGSMKPSLLVGDYLFVSKYSYGYSRHSLPLSLPLIPGRIFSSEPKRGDVAVFKLPKDNETDYIKRIVGLPGDKIQVREGRLYLNGKLVERKPLPGFPARGPFGSKTSIPQFEETLPNGVQHLILEKTDRGQLDNTGVYTVPPGHVFGMGDNRDDSQDSRVLSEVGYIPMENLVGRAEFLFFSYDPEGASWPVTVRWSRFFRRSADLARSAMTSVPESVAELETILRYSFADKKRLQLALTHSSLKQSKNDPSYERLEFLGDRVLGLVIAELMLEKFPAAAEGKLAPRLAALVSGATLADVARSLDLGAYILMTDGEAAAGTNARDSVLADCCEAVIGALYIDGGLETAGGFIRRVWEPFINDVEPRVAKSELQEWLQGRGLPLPDYTVVECAGPSHKPVFTVELTVSGRDPVRASGPSKRAAELLAASEMLQLIGKGLE